MTTATTSIEREVLDIEKQYWEASKTGDFETVERFTADPFVIVMDEGVTKFTPREFVDMMKKGSYKLLSYSIDERGATVTAPAKGVASIAYKVHEEYEHNGKRESREWYNCSVRVKDGDTWKLAVETMTPAKAA